MTELVESPWPAVLFGIIAMAILGVALVRTGRGVLLWAMLGVLLVTLGGVALERLVVTDREQVEESLYAAASAIEHNDVDGLFRYISASAPFTPGRARDVLRMYRFTEARITSVKVEINRLTSPPTATATMIGAFTVDDVSGQFTHASGRIGLTVELRLENGRWMITGHKEGSVSDVLKGSPQG